MTDTDYSLNAAAGTAHGLAPAGTRADEAATKNSGGTGALNLPAPIRAYFTANARLDAGGMSAGFAQDAEVRDEGNRHEGAVAIREWIDRSSIGLSAIATPQAYLRSDDTHRVTAQVTGEFSGSPVTLSFRFVLNGDRIGKLVIA